MDIHLFTASAPSCSAPSWQKSEGLYPGNRWRGGKSCRIFVPISKRKAVQAEDPCEGPGGGCKHSWSSDLECGSHSPAPLFSQALVHSPSCTNHPSPSCNPGAESGQEEAKLSGYFPSSGRSGAEAGGGGGNKGWGPSGQKPDAKTSCFCYKSFSSSSRSL